VEVLANFAEQVAALGVERADGEGVRIGLRVPASDSQFFGRPHAKELVAANRLPPVVGTVQVVGTGHWNFSGYRPLITSRATPRCRVNVGGVSSRHGRSEPAGRVSTRVPLCNPQDMIVGSA